MLGKYATYRLLNLRSTSATIPNVKPTWLAFSTTRRLQSSLVSPSFNTISTFHSLRNITKKANDSTVPNFLPIHARGPIPNMVISCSGTLYHLEGSNLWGEGKMLGLRSGVDRNLLKNNKHKIILTDSNQVNHYESSFFQNYRCFLWTLNFDWHVLWQNTGEMWPRSYLNGQFNCQVTAKMKNIYAVI